MCLTVYRLSYSGIGEFFGMLNVKLGDVVAGFGWRNNQDCTMYVDRIDYFPGTNDIMGIAGRIVGENGRLTQIREAIPKSHGRPEKDVAGSDHDTDIFSKMGDGPILKRGGWVVVEGYEIIGDPITLSEKIRSLEPGESFDVKIEDHPINSCRTSASLLGDKYGRKFRVVKNEGGCNIERID